VLMTAGCLLYMWRMIWQQKKLDDLKNEFINNMTHELRTPIAFLKSTHEALVNFGEGSDREKTNRYLQMNIKELDKLEGKVERALELARLENEGKPEDLQWVDLQKLLQAIISRYAA